MAQGDPVPSRDSVRVSRDGRRDGEALFETMRVEDGRAVFLDRHLARLTRSAETLGWDIVDRHELRSELERALAEHPSGRLRMRITASRGGQVDIETSPLLDDRPPAAITIVGAWQPGRQLSEHKTTSYAAYRRAQDLAAASGCGHALLLDARGRIGESAAANIVCAADGDLVTPPVSGILPGVARGVLLEAGLVRERNLPPELWGRADELIAVSSLRGAAPIVRVDGAPVGTGSTGPAASQLAEALDAAR